MKTKKLKTRTTGKWRNEKRGEGLEKTNAKPIDRSSDFENDFGR